MLLFESRHKEFLKQRKPEILTIARAEGLTHRVLHSFFDIYEDLLEANNLKTKPHCIFNLDETGLNTDRRSEAVFVNKDAKNAYLKSPTAGKTNFSVLFCVSAAGIYICLLSQSTKPRISMHLGLLEDPKELYSAAANPVG